MTARREQLGHRGPSQARADRHTIAQAFGQGHHVRDDAFMLEGEPGASAADAGLDFVQHHQPAMACAVVAQGSQVTRWCRQYATFPLDRLQQHRCNARAKCLCDRFQCRQITKAHLEKIPRQPLEAQPHRGAIARGHGAEGTAMKGVLHHHHQRLFDALFPAMQARQLERCLIGFSTGIIEEGAVQA